MIVLYDDDRARKFEPFATTRPLGEMRAGALLVRERWAHALHGSVTGFVASDAQRTFTEFDAPPFVEAGAWLAAGTVVANTRALPFVATRMPRDVDSWTVGGQVAAVRLHEALNSAALLDGSYVLTADASRRTVEIDGVWLDEVWDLIRHLNVLLASDIPALAAHLECTPLEDDGSRARGPVVVGAHPVWLETGAIVEPFTVFDTTLGAVLLRNAVLLAIAALVVRDVLQPERDVVRRDGVDDPAGVVAGVHPAAVQDQALEVMAPHVVDYGAARSGNGRACQASSASRSSAASGAASARAARGGT